MEINIDATDLILGRIATYAAKQALLGNKVNIVNSEKAVVTGTKRFVLAKYRQKRERGTPFKGTFLPRMPDRFVRRTIRGMLPYKTAKGREAFKRIMCYLEVPAEFKDKKLEKIDKSNITKLPNNKFVTVETICKSLGGKI